MSRAAAFQIDPPERLNPVADTSLMLAAEGQARGYALWCYQPADLSWKEGRLSARMRPMTLSPGPVPEVTLGPAQPMQTAAMDVIWMRQDPPFDMGYITATHLLEHALTRVVNDPASVRNAPEKLSCFLFPEYMPPTLVSADREEIESFAREHGDIIAKPLHGYGGRGVFRFRAEEGNIETLRELWAERDPTPLMWQAFLPGVADQERRILLIDGKPAACFGRRPAEGSIRANMRVGGVPFAAEPSPRQREVAEKIGVMARAQGLLIVGMDMIGDCLIEINVTSPTGFRAAEALYGTNLAARCWDALDL